VHVWVEQKSGPFPVVHEVEDAEIGNASDNFVGVPTGDDGQLDLDLKTAKKPFQRLLFNERSRQREPST